MTMHISETSFMIFDFYSVNFVTLGAWIRLFYEIFLRMRLLGRYFVSVSLYASEMLYWHVLNFSDYASQTRFR